MALRRKLVGATRCARVGPCGSVEGREGPEVMYWPLRDSHIRGRVKGITGLDSGLMGYWLGPQTHK